MVIDVRKLKYSGKTELSFSFDYEPEENLIIIPDAYIDGSIKVTGSLELHDDDVYVDGEINCKIVGKCARCTELAECDFIKSFSVDYVRDNPDDDKDEYLYKSGLVDLTLAVNEVILVSAPSIIYCREDCKGLCPICGGNLNEKDCNCKY